MDIGHFLKLMMQKRGSDMFLTTGAPIHVKIEGKMHPLGTTALPPGLVRRIASERQMRQRVFCGRITSSM